ncbi:MAG: 1-acyl-sn-glycerol-3-phosphate acyltransferase [Alphaproteobacteria bacterium]|nr:MAG: 1-acyl-sn-glycerol-3-phosphate acyltransferase [Alphaproteobacteria bacterium]
MNILRLLFYALLVRPFLIIFLGLSTRNLDRLQVHDGAHLVAANHNSHLDAMVLMSLFKLKDMNKVKLVAAKDYFCRNAFSTWFSLNIIGIIPIDRKGGSGDPLAPVIQALDKGYTVVIFPEGSRGEPEKRQRLKYGITKVLEAKPEIKITPVFMHGLGKSLPRGEGLFVPFICEINIGEDLSWTGDRSQLISSLEATFNALEQEMEPKEWL